MKANNLITVISQGKKKGLDVRKNVFGAGWCVILPNGSSYTAMTDKDMISFIKGY